MIIPAGYKDRHIGVFGLARTGIVAVQALVAAGAHVYAFDDNPESRKKVADHCVDLYALDFAVLDQLLIAPGVPLTHPKPHDLVIKAQAAGVPVIGDFDIFARGQSTLPAHTTIAITGTNGKSTTTALITHMLTHAGFDAVMGGNIGTGVLSLPPLPAGGIYVLEMSSYQIDLTHDFAPDIAILLNFSPDHLDRHGDMAGYIYAKSRLFGLVKPGGHAIIGVDDDEAASLSNAVANQGIAVTQIAASDNSQIIRGPGVSVRDNMVFTHKNGGPSLCGALEDCLTLQGPHNAQNMAAAFAVGQKLGIESGTILDSFKTFPGLAHRQEVVAVHDGVTFINDSKATNQDGAAKALSSFNNIIWIAGGVLKNPDLQVVGPSMHHVKKALFIGAAADIFMQELSLLVDAEPLITLQAAFSKAVSIAVSGDVILFSPAGASFDQFKDFEDRGNAFKALVQDYIRDESREDIRVEIRDDKGIEA